MLRYSLFALAGVCALQFFVVLPSLGVVVLLVVVAVICSVFRSSRPCAAFVFGGVLMWFAATEQLADRLDSRLVGKTLTITARVVDFPSFKGNAVRFLVEPIQPSEHKGLPRRIRLSWYEPTGRPRISEVWELKVRLKRPRGFSNPGGFDYEAWLHRQHIGATGYVSTYAKRLSENVFPADRTGTLRRSLAARIDALFPPGESRAVLKAISVAARGEISAGQWQLYARTGTSHLMAISGLHIGLAAGGAFVLAWLVLAPFVGRRNIRDIALIIAVISAFFYAELSGFAVPAKRAFLMAFLASAAILLRRQMSAQHIIGTVCIIVVVGDPLSVYTPGFMLSFLAVALLLWSARVYVPVLDSPDEGRAILTVRKLLVAINGLGRIQAVLLFGMLPMTISLFGRVALLAPLTNMLIVPLFNLVTVPACLLGLLFDGPASPVGDLLLRAALVSVEIALGIVGSIGAWPFAAIEPAVSGYKVLLISGTAMLWAVLPRGWPGRYVALVSLLATILYRPPLLAENCVSIHVLDVGQGLSVVLRTRDHTLIYDTGPSFRGGRSTAELVIGPFLRSLGVSAIDRLIVSHADLDHAGGTSWLRSNLDIRQLMLGEALKEAPVRFENKTTLCTAGQAWRWDGVRFRILHPEKPAQWHGNDASCVLGIEVGDHKLLIPGDIEKSAELELMASGMLAAVDLVVVPHHGSRTSSGQRFVRTLQPSVAIVAAGYRNRWGLPKPDVMARWRAVGTQIVSTALSGALSRQYCAGRAAGPLRLHRVSSMRYWHDQGS